MDRNDLVSDLTRQQSEIDELKERASRLERTVEEMSKMPSPQMPSGDNHLEHDRFERRARINGILLLMSSAAMIALMVLGSYYRWYLWLSVVGSVGSFIGLRMAVKQHRKQRGLKTGDG